MVNDKLRLTMWRETAEVFYHKEHQKFDTKDTKKNNGRLSFEIYKLIIYQELADVLKCNLMAMPMRGRKG